MKLKHLFRAALVAIRVAARAKLPRRGACSRLCPYGVNALFATPNGTCTIGRSPAGDCRWLRWSSKNT